MAEGLKQAQLEHCICCSRGMAHAGQVHFYRVKVEQMVLNVRAIERQHGFEMMLGPAAALAQVLGPDEDMAIRMGEVAGLICADCAMRLPVAALLNMKEDTDETDPYAV